MIKIIIIILFSIPFSQDCSWWQTWIEEIPESVNVEEDDENCFSTNDLERLQEFIDLNESLSDYLPLEIGSQSWEDNRLTYLNMYSSGIDTIPNSINDLSELKNLYLSSNPLTNIPESIGELDRLERFYIHTCQIQAVPESFGNLTNLKSIWIYNNQLSSLPESFGELENLEILKIANNNLDSLPYSFGYLHNLEELDILNNNLTSLPENFEELTNLNYLNLFNNNLNNFLQNLSEFDKLDILNLENNSLDSISNQICDVIDSLSFFSINNNNICPPYPDCLSEIEIGIQNLESCELCDSSFVWVSNVPEFVYLDQTTNCFNIEDLSILEEITLFNNLNYQEPFYNYPQTWYNGRLTELNLSNFFIIGIPEIIQNLDELKVLDLSDNEIFFLNNAIVEIHKLEVLNLINNPLMALPNAIGNLTTLKNISINSSNLDSLPISFGELDSLEFVFINNTQIKNIPEGLSITPNLQTLHLSDNQIEELPNNLCELHGNCFINVSNNNLCNEYYFDCINEWGSQNCLSISKNDIIDEFKIIDVYPNPFNSITTIEIEIPNYKNNEDFTFQIFNLNGDLIKRQNIRNLQSGTQKVYWNANSNASGIYILKCNFNEAQYSKKITIMK